MADLLDHLPVTRLVPAGRHGRMDGAAGVTARLIADTAAATLVARRGVTPSGGALGHGLALPEGPKAAFGGGLSVIGTGPGRWLAVADALSGEALQEQLAGALGDQVARTDQSDALLIFEISGLRARDALATLCTLDLDPLAFAPGDAATTAMAFVGVTVWQVDAAPIYRCAVARSFSAAFLRALAAGALQYGFALEGTGRG